MQSEIRTLARQFAQKEILPRVEEDEKTETFRPELIEQLGSLGLTGIPVSETYEGAGLGYREYTAAIEEIAKASASYAISVAVTGLPQVILSNYGTEEQKKRWIPPLATGKAIGAFSLSEAVSGSDAAALITTAKKEGNSYLLNGTKLWCTQGDVAETLIVMARTGGEGPKGISAFVVEKGMSGFRLGKREKKMGCGISHTMELVFENTKIPESHLIGKEGEGFKIALSALDSGRITIAATAVGIAQAALDCAVHHAKEREQFGKPIGAQQGVAFLLADMGTQIEAARLLVQQAATLKDKDQPYSQQAAMAKLFATDTAMKVTTDAVQILGGSGYTSEFPVERYMREAKVTQIVEGTNQIQRLVVGRHLLGGLR
ncbi:MAG: acyl-CoA dehydrogenase [Bdellovibrionaceae bacterium]|nr:acyl-CoA dehydrogenase [Pseudobdellovibrionaceae bacterium]|tara:strand:+ start:4216 stop:5337 length:1122 start_codon:yes stop_codon:yes gene_type:complete